MLFICQALCWVLVWLPHTSTVLLLQSLWASRGSQTPNQAIPDVIIAKELVKEESLCHEGENTEKDTLRLRHLGKPL